MGYKRGRNIEISDVYCPICGARTTVPRSPGKTRNLGHNKVIWCYMCKTERNFEEVREKDFTLIHVREKKNNRIGVMRDGSHKYSYT